MFCSSCSAMMPATITRPMRSETVPGISSVRPPMTASTRSGQPIFRRMYPSRPAATAKMPSSAVMTIWTTWKTLVTFSKSICGLYAKMNGTMKAAMASFVALMPVFMGFDFAMAEPA